MTESRKLTEERRAKRRMKQLASERYAENHRDCMSLLDLIREHLKSHAEKAAKKPADWTYVGDVASTREELKAVLLSLLIGKYPWSETEASRFIEDLLEKVNE